jgi:hypothetical protein
MSGFPNGYSDPGTVTKASDTMMHARAVKKFKKTGGIVSRRRADRMEYGA